MNTIVMILTSSGGTALLIKLIDILQDKFSEKRKSEKETIQEILSKVDSCNCEKIKDLKGVKEDIDELREDFLVIMHDRIYNIFKQVSTKQTIIVREKSNLDYLYERYKKRFGNHDAKNYYDLICKMKIVADEDEKD